MTFIVSRYRRAIPYGTMVSPAAALCLSGTGWGFGAEQPSKRIDQDRAGGLQFLQALGHGPLEGLGAFRRQLHQNVPAAGAAFAGDEPVAFRPVDELHRAVMSNPQAGCQCAHCRLDFQGKALDREQQLVLPGFKARRFGGVITEVQVVVNILAEVGQRPVIRIADPLPLS